MTMRGSLKHMKLAQEIRNAERRLQRLRQQKSGLRFSLEQDPFGELDGWQNQRIHKEEALIAKLIQKRATLK